MSWNTQACVLLSVRCQGVAQVGHSPLHWMSRCAHRVITNCLCLSGDRVVARSTQDHVEEGAGSVPLGHCLEHCIFFLI